MAGVNLRQRCSRRRVSPKLAFVSRSDTSTFRGFTLVEMLVAMAITLVMMGAVVTLFANVSGSVSRRRATMEMSSQLRSVRNVLQQDLQGATCPGLTWQRPESNHGYIELIEGEFREGRASRLVDGINLPLTPDFNPEIDHALSILPSSNLPFTGVTGQENWATDGGGLGDYDDILMLTVRNEHHPFVGRMPLASSSDPTIASRCVRPNGGTANTFDKWVETESIESPLAEVVWFAIENPEPEPSTLTPHRYFGEPGMRTVYRRTLLIAPWVNPYRHVNQQTGAVTDTFSYDGGNFKAEPGLVRILPRTVGAGDVDQAIAAVIAIQDRYDLSVRLEWDHNLNPARWKIMANTLGDLTKRENRFGHYGYRAESNPANAKRIFPYAVVSTGAGYSGSTADLKFVADPEAGRPTGATQDAKGTANLKNGSVYSYSTDAAPAAPMNYTDIQRRYATPPFVYVDKTSSVPATAQAILNKDGAVVRVVFGPTPLWGARRLEDVMLTDVLAFDLRVFDPAAPLFATRKLNSTSQNFDPDVILAPSDPGWPIAYLDKYQMKSNGSGQITVAPQNPPNDFLYSFVGQGAYVDLGYGYNYQLPAPVFSISSTPQPWFFEPAMELAASKARKLPATHGGTLVDVYGNQLAPGFAVYDTWSFHYENNGVNEDTPDPTVDQGTDGLDGVGHYLLPPPPPSWPAAPPFVATANATILGVDDVGERETVPPYDKPLRGVQVIMRAYERDSRAIKQVRVNQHFMPE